MKWNKLALWMTLAIIGDQLQVTWNPHPDNHQLQVVYQCDKTSTHPPYVAVNIWEILPEKGSAQVRRVPTPVGQECWIYASIMRTFDGWDGDQQKLLRAEWQVLKHTEIE